MPRIPFNPSLRPVAASQVRASSDQSQYGIAVQERATQNLVGAARDATLAGGKVYVNELEKQFNTDMLAGGAMLDELKFKRDEELSKIPVDSSVDYDKVSGEINARYNREWDSWSQKNIRNLNHDIVADMRQSSVNAFTIDGKTTAEKGGVVYENKRNLNQLEKSDGIYATQLKRNPNDPAALDGLYRNQDARVLAGFQTEAEAAANKAAIQNKAFDENDDQVKQMMDQLVYDGRYEEAEGLVEKFSPNTSKADALEIKNDLFGASTYNRFNNIASGVKTLEGWDAFDAEVKDDKYMSQDRHKAALDNRSTAGRRKILKAQDRNMLEIGREAAKGEFDVTDWQLRSLDGSENGVQDPTGKLMEEYINKASLYTSKLQVKEDAKLFTQATKEGDAESQYNKLLKLQINGEMREAEFFKVMDEIRGKSYAEPVRRQMEREAFKAFDASLAGGEMEDYDGVFAFGGEPVPAQAQSVYQAFTVAMQKQDAMVGSYIDGAENVASVREKVAEWSKVNPSPSAAEVEKFTKSIVDPIDDETRIELRKRF